MLSTREYLLKLERNLMVGSGRWVADFVESFWNHPVGDVTFDLLIRGGMRPKGFVVSRVVALLTTPNYQVACFGYTGDPELKRLPSVLRAVRNYMQDHQVEWAWLVIPHEGEFPSKVRARVEKNDLRELGIALVDLTTQEIVASRSYVGRRMSRFVRCFK